MGRKLDNLDKLEAKIAAGLRSESARPFLEPYISARIRQLTDEQVGLVIAGTPDTLKIMVNAARIAEVKMIYDLLERGERHGQAALAELNRNGQ